MYRAVSPTLLLLGVVAGYVVFYPQASEEKPLQAQEPIVLPPLPSDSMVAPPQNLPKAIVHPEWNIVELPPVPIPEPRIISRTARSSPDAEQPPILIVPSIPTQIVQTGYEEPIQLPPLTIPTPASPSSTPDSTNSVPIIPPPELEVLPASMSTSGAPAPLNIQPITTSDSLPAPVLNPTGKSPPLDLPVTKLNSNVVPGDPDKPFWSPQAVNPWQHGRTFEGPRTVIVQERYEPMFWIGTDFLIWFTKNANAPPLIQSIPTAQLNTAFNPALATTLFPTDSVNASPLYGFRTSIGGWLSEEKDWGLEGNYLRFQERSKHFTTGSNLNSILGRPYLDVGTNRADFIPVSITNTILGSSQARTTSEMQGFDTNFIFAGYSVLADSVTFIAGFRYFELKEGIQLIDRSVLQNDGSMITSVDEFRTKNEFYGGQIGARMHYQTGPVTLDLTTTIAYGSVRQNTQIDGVTIGNFSDGSSTAITGGNLALSTNIGNRSRSQSAFLPEVNLRMGYQFSENGLFFVGYNFLYLSDVLRPGSQIDTGINPRFFPIGAFNSGSNTIRPIYIPRNEDFWAQGINLGLAFQF